MSRRVSEATIVAFARAADDLIDELTARPLKAGMMSFSEHVAKKMLDRQVEAIARWPKHNCAELLLCLVAIRKSGISTAEALEAYLSGDPTGKLVEPITILEKAGML